MSIDVSKIQQAIEQKQRSNLTSLEMLQLNKALNLLKAGNVHYYSTFSDLPVASSVLGQLVYIVDEKAVYYAGEASNLITWIYLGVTSISPLFLTGLNVCGIISSDTFQSICFLTPTQEVTSAINWSYVARGGCNIMVIKDDGTLWAWGRNAISGLGIAPAGAQYSSPTQEARSFTDWCTASLSEYSSFGVRTNGTLWAAGYNNFGQLGVGDVGVKSTFTQEASSATNWCSVKSGGRNGYSNMGLKTTGELFVWGSPCCLPLNCTTICYSSPVQEITSASDWCDIDIGNYAWFGIKTNGTLWALAGPNVSFHLGTGAAAVPLNETLSSPVQEITSSTDWCQVSGGGQTSYALKTNNTLYAAGANNVGNLGVGCTSTWSNSFIQEVTSATDWCQVSGGYGATAMKTNNTIWGWGGNYRGELGMNSMTKFSSPVQEITSSTDWCFVVHQPSSLYRAAIRNISTI